LSENSCSVGCGINHGSRGKTIDCLVLSPLRLPAPKSCCFSSGAKRSGAVTAARFLLACPSGRCGGWGNVAQVFCTALRPAAAKSQRWRPAPSITAAAAAAAMMASFTQPSGKRYSDEVRVAGLNY
jgi:hypothetical protein